MWFHCRFTKLNCGRAVSHLKDTAKHAADAGQAKVNKNVAEVKSHVKSGEHPELKAQKEAAKGQEKASIAAAKGHADDVRAIPFSLVLGQRQY